MGSHSKFVQENEMLALGICMQVQELAKAADLPLQDHVCITTNNFSVSTATNSMKCFVNWNPLNMQVRFRKKPILL